MTEPKSNFGSFYKVILISGKKKDWTAWEEKFLSKANVKGYEDIVLGKVTIPKSTVVIDTKDDTGKELLRIQEKNDSGYLDLIIKRRNGGIQHYS
jgi:hypothetical protein